MSCRKRVAAIAVASLFAGTPAFLFAGTPALAQQKPASQPNATDEQTERKLFDATSNLEGELKRLNGDLDALIDKAAASQKPGAAAPAPQPGAPAAAAPR